MTVKTLLQERLLNQLIASPIPHNAAAVVGHLGAMQAQEYAHAKWAIGLRLKTATDAMVEEAFNKGEILRTHLLRPTWHFVSPADIRWLLALTAARVHAVNGTMYRQTELDEATLRRSRKILEKELRDENYRTRNELAAALAKSKIAAAGMRLSYLMMHAELEGLLCSGPRKGKQFTYALLEERAKPVAVLTQAEALAALAEQYFGSRGPATVADFSWWSGLTLKDARSGAASLPADFIMEQLDGLEYYFRPSGKKFTATMNSTFLMPDYDEYAMAYKDRKALQGRKNDAATGKVPTTDYSHWLVLNGRIEGVWEREQKGSQWIAGVTPFHKPSAADDKRIATAVARFVAFANGKL